MSSAYAAAEENALRKPGLIAERLRNTKASAIANVIGKSDACAALEAPQKLELE